MRAESCRAFDGRALACAAGAVMPSAPACEPAANPAPAARARRAAAACAFVLAFVAAALAGAAAFPSQACADDYSMPSVDISAEVLEDGTLAVYEQRVFDFDGSFTCVWWTFDNLPQGSTLAVNGVSLVDSDGVRAQLDPVPFQTQWRDSGGPGIDSYSVDEARNSVYVFFEAADERLTVGLDYALDSAAQAYSDVAELYWKYVGSQWAEPSRDVSCVIKLPVPSGASVQPGDDVRAWGHGPLDGSVSIEDDGTVVYDVGKVSSGEFAEARIVFPKEWLSQADPAAVQDREALPGILSEEQQWADEANDRRNASRALMAVCLIAALAIVAWALFMFFRHGREYKPEFDEEYWRDVPDPKAQPAEIGRLWRREAESPDDFTATIMHLAHAGAISMEKGSYQDDKGALVEDYCMVKVPHVADAVTFESDPIGRTVLDMLFDQFPAGGSAAASSSQPHVWFGTIKEYGKKHPEEFDSAMKRFQSTLSVQVDRLGYFEAKGSMLKMLMLSIGFVVALLAVLLGMFVDNFVPAAAGVAAGGAVAVISRFMGRMTHHGAEVRARAEALARWLKDFSSLDERPPTDVKVWGEFMVYAYEFGIAEQVVKALRLKVPELFDAQPDGSAYVPWWFWYSPHYAYGGAGSLADSLSTTVSNTVSTVSEALSANSSAGGFGGGFSMGGGGGFGGGGGGAR